MRFASIIVGLALVPSCIFFEHGSGGGGGDDVCVQPATDVPAFSQRLVNPETLACQTFTQPTCDPQCGPCPGGAIFVPPWGECASPCVGLSESACMADTQCRVARSFSDYYGRIPGVDDFMGCFPLNTGEPPDVQRCEGLDAEQCAWQSDCSALYDGAPGQCNAFAPEQCIGAQFKECITESRTDPGECTFATCDAVGPNCPSGTTAGILNGCYTGACIPNALCTATGG